MKTGPIDLSAVRRIHNNFKRDNRELVGETLEEAGEFGEDHVASFSTFKRRSAVGQSLKDATEHKLVRTKNHHRLFLISKKKYAAPIDLGSRPHPIRAIRAKALRFIGKNGQVVFRREVFHKGNRPYRFLWKANWAAFRWSGQKLGNGMHRLTLKTYR